MESPEDTQLAILTFPSNWDLHFHDWFQENYSVQNKEKLEILAEQDYMTILAEMQIGQKLKDFM